MLVAAKLSEGVLRAFRKKSANIVEIANSIAGEYFSYAANGMVSGPVVGDVPLLLGKERIGLQQGIASVMSARLPSAVAAQTIGNAVTRFWLVPPVLTSGLGTVSAIIVAPGVAKMFASNAASDSEAAQNLADALDLMTRTVTFLYPPPLGPGILV